MPLPANLPTNLPDDRTHERMLAAFNAACDRLQVHDTADAPVWGWRGRTLSRRVMLGMTPCWMRVASHHTDQIAETFWRGNLTAEHQLPQHVPKPRLLRFEEHIHGEWAYAAELFTMSKTAALSRTPATLRTILPDGRWWQHLRDALNAIASVPTSRQTITPSFIDETTTHMLGHGVLISSPEAWVTAHGDLHWANLGGPVLTIFDWEGWGLAPPGYDAATLLVHSLHCRNTTAEVRRRFTDQLDTPAGKDALRVVLAEHLWVHRAASDTAYSALLRSELERLSR